MGNRHAFGECSPSGKAGLIVVVANLKLALTARFARSAANAKGHSNAIAHSEAADLRSHRFNDASQFMPRHMRQCDIRVVTHPAVPVTAAKSCGTHTNHDAVSGWCWIRNVLQRQRPAKSLKHYGSHAAKSIKNLD